MGEEEEGKIPVGTSEKTEIENQSSEEKTEGKNPTPTSEKEEGGEREGKEKVSEDGGEEEGEEEGLKEKNQETQESNSDSVTVRVASGSPYAEAVAGVKAEFSAGQLQELEQQTLIYRYMAAAVPVPTHLVFPIWKTVTASAAGPSPTPPEHFPTLMGLATLCLDFGKSPEPEPGRCRRTDGKKWRCWRNVVPDQKYCERHLHRGRKRPIQAVEIIDGPDDATSSPVVAVASSAGEVDEGSKKRAKKVNRGESQVAMEVNSS